MIETTTKDIIYTEARRLFSLRGYPATSIRDIADAVGIKGASIYSHIESKEDLLWDMVMQVADAFRERVLPALHSEAPVERRLTLAMHAHIGVITDNIESATIYFHEWRYLCEERREEVLRRRDGYEHEFRHIIAEGMTTGDFAPGNPKYAAILLLASLNAIYTWYKPKGSLAAEAMAEMYAGRLMKSLK